MKPAIAGTIRSCASECASERVPPARVSSTAADHRWFTASANRQAMIKPPSSCAEERKSPRPASIAPGTTSMKAMSIALRDRDRDRVSVAIRPLFHASGDAGVARALIHELGSQA